MTRLELALSLLATYFHIRLRNESLAICLAECPSVSNKSSLVLSLAQIEAVTWRVRHRLGLPCLPAALALKTCLAFMGLDTKLIMGLDPDSPTSGHAWLEVGDSDLLRGNQRWTKVWAEE